MANRTTLVDNNTWNNSHIALVKTTFQGPLAFNMVFLRWGRQCLRMRALPTTSWPSWMSITSLSSSGGSLAILEMTSTNSSGWWEMSMLCSAKKLLSAYSVSPHLLLVIFRCASQRASTHRTSRSRTTSLRGGSSGWTAREAPPCSTASCTNSPTTGTVREQLSNLKLRIMWHQIL